MHTDIALHVLQSSYQFDVIGCYHWMLSVTLEKDRCTFETYYNIEMNFFAKTIRVHYVSNFPSLIARKRGKVTTIYVLKK